MVKKVLSMTLIFVLVSLILAGCGSTAQPAEPNKSSGNGATGTAAAEIAYPTKAISLHVGFSAGGSSDLMARIVAAKLTENLGQPVTVINKTGGGGWVLWTEAIKTMPADGYNLVLVNTPNYSVAAYDSANPKEYKYDALDLLMNQVTDFNVIAIRKDEKRYTDFKSFVEFAKKNELLAAASGNGISSDDATIIDGLNLILGTKITTVQTAGAKDNETMFISKNTDILIANAGDVLSAYKNGDYNIICTFAPDRSKLLPDVPTASELGFGEIVGYSSRGYALPKGVDPKIKEKLAKALEATINDPEVIKKLDEMGAETNFVTGEAYYKLMEKSIETSKKIYGIQ